MYMSTANQLIHAAKRIIRYNNLPTCYSCIFYKEKITNNVKEHLCRKFGTKNIITGTITYSNVVESRFDNEKCGEKGEHYMEKQ